VQLSELVDHLCPARVNGQLSPLSVHADGRVSRSGQQHAGLLIQAEEGGARLKSLRRRRVGVVGHDLQETRGTGNPSHSHREGLIERERRKTDSRRVSRCSCLHHPLAHVARTFRRALMTSPRLSPTTISCTFSLTLPKLNNCLCGFNYLIKTKLTT